jgi:hypothetical protein
VRLRLPSTEGNWESFDTSTIPSIRVGGEEGQMEEALDNEEEVILLVCVRNIGCVVPSFHSIYFTHNITYITNS